MLVSLPLSTFGMSLSQAILGANWLSEGKYKKKFNDFFHNKVAIAIVSIFILHVIGLLYTTDFGYAMKDLKIKSPLFILPFILSTTEKINIKQLYNLLLVFISFVLLGTLISTYHFLKDEYLDIRDISLFISHIRFSLLICFSIFILAYLYFKRSRFPKPFRYVFLILILWFTFFLIILEAFTGIAILLVISFVFLVYFIFTKKNRITKISLIIILIVFPISVYYYINSIYQDSVLVKVVDLSKLDYYTPHGNIYYNDIYNDQRENGNLVGIYVCIKEIEESWKKRSKFDINGKDLKGQQIKSTLIRYLTSLDKRKDTDGINSLTNEQIIQIEKGVANAKYQDRFSIRDRIYESFWEIQNYLTYKNPNGQTLVQRYIYWKASIELIKENPILGVGTGDMNIAFNNHYDQYYKELDKAFRWRSHNQYLSITVAFGFIGLIWFLIALFYPVFKAKKVFNYLYITFFLIMIISMLTEDTIETQPGVTFFAFFSSLFLFTYKEEKDEKSIE